MKVDEVVVDGEDDRPPSLEEKTKFAHNIYKIKSEELGEVMTVVVVVVVAKVVVKVVQYVVVRCRTAQYGVVRYTAHPCPRLLCAYFCLPGGDEA